LLYDGWMTRISGDEGTKDDNNLASTASSSSTPLFKEISHFAQKQ
jgi:hypothetical protein